MQLLEPTHIRDLCDYSFGDNSGQDVVPNWHMHPANINNADFIAKYREVLKSGRKVMTLFIDNIRLYRRDNVKYTAQEENNETLQRLKDARVKLLHKDSDLLQLCHILADMEFVIFSAFDDTPTDEAIFDKIPHNVKAIYASNALTFGGKVKPFPYGLQRKMNPYDNRLEIISSLIEDKSPAYKLLYVNHSLHPGVSSRDNINEIFENKKFATVDRNRHAYLDFYKKIKEHKFVLCPSGNAKGCECHRDWETLYMRRVPVVLRSEYLEVIFKDLPVLFVDSWSEVTEELLLANNHLYQKAQNMDMSRLDLDVILPEIIGKYIKESGSVMGVVKAPAYFPKVNINSKFEILILDINPPFYPVRLNKGYFLSRPSTLGNIAEHMPERDEFSFETEAEAEHYLAKELIPVICTRADMRFIIRKTYGH